MPTIYNLNPTTTVEGINKGAVFPLPLLDNEIFFNTVLGDWFYSKSGKWYSSNQTTVFGGVYSNGQPFFSGQTFYMGFDPQRVPLGVTKLDQHDLYLENYILHGYCNTVDAANYWYCYLGVTLSDGRSNVGVLDLNNQAVDFTLND